MSTVIGRVMPLPKGEYDPSETYNILDIVSDAMGSWIGTKNNIVVAPGTDDSWMLIANHGSSVKTGTAISGTGMGLTGAQGILGDKYINTDNNRMYTCVQSGTASTALWNYVTTLGGISHWSDLEGKPFATLDEYDIDDNPTGSFTITNEELKLSTYAKDRLAKVDINENISSALQDKISEPLAEGTEGQALITDGNGGRSWGDVDSLVKSVESTEFAVSGAGKLSLDTDVADAIADIPNKADRDQITSASDVWVTPHIGGYKVGDIVIHDNTIYECITAQAQGSEVSPTAASGSTYWTASSVLSALKSSLANSIIIGTPQYCATTTVQPNAYGTYPLNVISKDGYTCIGYILNHHQNGDWILSGGFNSTETYYTIVALNRATAARDMGGIYGIPIYVKND